MGDLKDTPVFKQSFSGYEDRPWWDDYDGDIEEEKYEIEQRVLREIEDSEEQLDMIADELDKIEYNEYFAYNLQFRNECSLIILRKDLKRKNIPEDVSIEEFIAHILDESFMFPCEYDNAQIFLIINFNKKITFLNTIKLHNDYDRMIERGIKKMKREYGNEWKEDDDKIYEIVPVAMNKPI